MARAAKRRQPKNTKFGLIRETHSMPGLRGQQKLNYQFHMTHHRIAAASAGNTGMSDSAKRELTHMSADSATQARMIEKKHIQKNAPRGYKAYHTAFRSKPAIRRGKMKKYVKLK